MSTYIPSADEQNYYGDSAARAHYGTISVSYIQFGIELFMVLYGLSIFIETPKEYRKGRGKFILASIAILITSALSTAFDGWKVFRNLYNGGPTGIEYLAAWRQDHEQTKSSIATGIAGDTMLVTNIALGDVLLLWRCFVIWKDKWWIIVIPTLTCIFSVAFGVVAIIPDSFPQAKGLTPVISTTLSVAMNIMVTSLILFRLIRMRKKMSRVLQGRQTPSLYGDIVTILIESAVPLAFFGLCFVIATFVLVYKPLMLVPRAGVYAFEEVVATFYYAFASLSPQMIIFRVTTGRSWKSGDESDRGAAVFSQPIQFARTIEARGFSASSVISAEDSGREGEERKGSMV